MRRLGSVSVLCLFIALFAAASEIDDLARNLKSRNVDTRVEAVESLGRLKSAAAAELLAQALSDREAKVRGAAARALWDSSDTGKAAIPALRKTLDDQDPYVVACAAGALIAMDVPETEVAEALRGVLRRGDDYDRFLAARLLIGVEPAGNLVVPIVDYLRRNLPDDRLGVREEIDRRDNFEFGMKELIKLGKTHDRTQIEPLMKELAGAPPALVPPILMTLGEMKPPPDRWTEILIAQTGSQTAAIRAKAVELLGKQTSAADVAKWAPVVARLTKDSDPNVRGWSVSTLDEGKGLAHEGFSALVEIIRSDRDEHLRARAADVVGDIGDAKYPIDSAIKASMGKQALPVLTAAIEKDSNKDVRENALQSLARLQLEPSEVAPVLARAAVEGKGMGFRTDALILLGNLGTDGAAAKAMIEPLTRDPDPEVARIAKATLQSISTPSPAESSRKQGRPATSAADPAARERALAVLREKDVQFADWDYARALTHLDEEVVKAFLDAGMSPNRKFNYGTLPLQMVLDSDHPCAEIRPLVKLLLDHGADVNGADDNGNSVLATAAKACDGDMIRMLVKAGAKVQAKNAMGFTALESAIMMGNTAAGAALVVAGARLDAEKAKTYRETYKKQPKMLELITMASKK